MLAGLSIFWVGYTLSFFGYCSIRGPGVGLFDLIIPGRPFTMPGSSSASGANIGTPGTTITGPGGSSLNTGPTGSHIVHTPNGDTIEPNVPNVGGIPLLPGGTVA